MTALLPTFYLFVLAGIMLLGLLLFAIGIVLLVRLKNKLIGGLSIAAGVVLAVLPVLIFLAQFITFSVRS